AVELDALERQVRRLDLLAGRLGQRLGQLGVVERGLALAGHGVDEDEFARPVCHVVAVPEAVVAGEPVRLDRRLEDLVLCQAAEAGRALVVLLRALGIDEAAAEECRHEDEAIPAVHARQLRGDGVYVSRGNGAKRKRERAVTSPPTPAPCGPSGRTGCRPSATRDRAGPSRRAFCGRRNAPRPCP